MRYLCCLLPLLLAAMPSAAARWQFRAELQPDPGILQLQACSADPASTVVFVSERGGGALQAVRRTGGQSVTRRGDRVEVTGWQPGDCVDFRIDLQALAAEDRYGLGQRTGHYFRVAPARWLWRPARVDADSTIHFRLPAGWSLSVPWSAQQDGGYRLGDTPADWPALVAFGRFVEHRLVVPGGQLRVAVLPLGDAHDESALVGWLRAVAGDLLQTYGRLPLRDAQVLLHPLPGVTAAVPWGQVTRGGGSAIHLYAGVAAGAAAWRADWTATHEAAHLLHPYLGRSGRWLGEGLASYYQNVLRARSGALTAAEAWERLRAGFARGRRASAGHPAPLADVVRNGQRGATMRIYWAGAAFWLEADLALRQSGDSLDRVLDAFARQHLPSGRRWDPADFVAALAEHAPEFDWQGHYRRYAEARAFPDIETRLAELGLSASTPPPTPPWASAIMQGRRDNPVAP